MLGVGKLLRCMKVWRPELGVHPSTGDLGSREGRQSTVLHLLMRLLAPPSSCCRYSRITSLLTYGGSRLKSCKVGAGWFRL